MPQNYDTAFYPAFNSPLVRFHNYFNIIEYIFEEIERDGLKGLTDQVVIPEESIKKHTNSKEAINEHSSGEGGIYGHTNCVHYFENL